MNCEICHSVEPYQTEDSPCLVRPRFYVNEKGLIIGKINGCPYSSKRTPVFIDDELIHQSKIAQEEIYQTAMKEVNYEDYQNLWTSWDGQDHLLARDPKEALRRWLSSFPSRVSFTFQGSINGGNRSHYAGLRFVELAERFSLVQDNSLGLLPQAWYWPQGDHVWW